MAEYEDQEFQQRIQQIDALVRRIEALADNEARTSAIELFQLVLDLHGAGFRRLLDIAADSGDAGRRMMDKLAGDELVSSLLLLYGLHPLDLDTRVRQALDKCRPYLQSHGGNVTLLGTDGGVVKLKLEGSCHGCGASADTLKLLIEEAISEAAPDITGLQVEGALDGAAKRVPADGLVQLQSAARVCGVT